MIRASDHHIQNREPTGVRILTISKMQQELRRHANPRSSTQRTVRSLQRTPQFNERISNLINRRLRNTSRNPGGQLLCYLKKWEHILRRIARSMQ